MGHAVPSESDPSTINIQTALCRSIFDIDGIDLGPERRHYLEHKFERVWEVNCQGSIPYLSLIHISEPTRPY